MPKAGSVEHKSAAGRAEMAVSKGEAEQHGSAEYKRRRNQSGQKLPCHQQFAPHGREKIIVQAFFHYFPAEEPCEQAHTAKENAHAEIEDLKHICQYPRVFVNTAVATHGAGQCMDTEHRGGSEGQQVNPYAAAHPQVLSDLDA